MNEIISTEAVNSLVESGIFGYIGKKVLGATLDNIGNDVANLYAQGRDKIIEKASKKIKNLDDGQQVNLRIARDVFYNGSFSDDEICAEYFGGILASSRSEDGTDDSKMFYLDTIKSLSSIELKIHYIIYYTFHKMMINKDYSDIKIGYDVNLGELAIYFNHDEVINISGVDIHSSQLHILRSKGLIKAFQTGHSTSGVHYLGINPSSLGIQLFAIVNNIKLDDFINKSDLNIFEGIKTVDIFNKDINLLKHFS